MQRFFCVLGLILVSPLANAGSELPNPLGVLVDLDPNQAPKDVWSIEYGNEMRAPLVFATKKEGDVLLRQADDRDLWLKPRDKAQIRTFEDILQGDHMTYLTQNWDAKIHYDATKSSDFSKRSAFRLPGRKMPKPTKDHLYWASRDVEVLERKTVDGTLWLKVRLVDRTACATPDGKPIYAKHPVTGKEVTGWVPTRNDAGGLNFWFYTRGC